MRFHREGHFAVRRYRPFLLSLAIVAMDQLSKAIVVKTIPEGSIAASFFSDWLRIVHVRNNAVAFSLGSSLAMPLKVVLFIILPCIMLSFISYMVASRKFDGELSTLERYCLAGIVGGGCGNLIDRVFRSFRVVDFISTDMNGFLGFSRFPTYNIADASVVVSVALLILSALLFHKEEKNGQEG